MFHVSSYMQPVECQMPLPYKAHGKHAQPPSDDDYGHGETRDKGAQTHPRIPSQTPLLPDLLLWRFSDLIWWEHGAPGCSQEAWMPPVRSPRWLFTA